MNRLFSMRRRLAWVFLLLIVVFSCSREVLPEVPAFAALGFSDSPEVVRDQVQAVYREWQDHPLDPDRNGSLGMHLSVYGKHAVAAILYARARALAPDEFRWTYYLAYSLREEGRLEEAAQMFREAVKIKPWYKEAHIQLAALLWKMFDIEGSGKLYKSITEKYPDRVEGWLGLGKVYHHQGDYAAAIDALKRARKLGPEYGEIRYTLAMAFRENGDEEAAAREFTAYKYAADNKIASSDKLVEKIRVLNVSDERHMVIGSALFSQGRYRSAAKSYLAALAINPHSVDAWNGLVSTHVLLGEIDAAGDVYREAIAAGVSYARFHLNYGVAMLDAGQIDAAREAIGNAIQLDPQFADAFSEFGRLEVYSGDFFAAARQYARSLQLRPNHWRTRISLARALITSRQHEEAVEHLEMLLSNPSVGKAEILRDLALAYHGMGHRDKAAETVQRAREAARRTNNRKMKKKIDALIAEWGWESAGQD